MARVCIVGFNSRAVVLRRWLRRERFAVIFGEILTVERRRRDAGLILHTRTEGDLSVVRVRRRLFEIENEFRSRGVRVVDCWGAIIAPTVSDFAAALADKPRGMRQSSDDA